FPNPSRWAKAYELIHCVEGLAELYRATGKADYLRAAENVAADLIANERTISGNISLGDRLNHAPLNPEAYSEVCDAVYYARLCAQLLQLTGKVVYANELERTFYNSLCAAANADGDWVAGHLSLKAAHVTAPMHCLLNHQHCCVANAPRGLLQAAEHAVMTGKDGATFNLYLPGDFALALPGGDKLKLAVQTDYPATGSIHITVNPATAKTFSVSLRIPDWSAKTTVKVNGQPLPGVKANSYFPIRREWKAGDRIELNLDLRGRVTKFPDAAQSFVAVERGPLVLARDSLLRNDAVNSAVALAADKDGFIPLQPARAPKGFWLTFTAPLVGGGSIPMCDYASVGEIYKRQITNLFSSPARPGLPSAPPKPGVVADSAEDFRVWLPTVKQNAAIQEWNFDQSGDLQGWQANAHLKNVAVTNGALVARADGSDPILELKPLLDLPAAADQVVEIRLKSDRSGEAEWFWSNTAAGKYGGFSGEKSTRFNVLGDGQWHTYRLLPCWHAEGRIVRLRLDVFDGARFELDFIRIVQLAMSPAATGADFDFSRGAQGWQWLDTVVEKTSAPWPGGKFRSTSAGELLSPPLKFDAEENNWVSVRMAVDQGRYGTIFFATKKSSRLHQYNFPIQADGREHTYNLDLLAVPDWRGEIVLLGLRPGEAATPADVRWLKAGDAPQGPAQLTVRAFGLENALPRAGAPLTLAAFIANNGGKPATNLQPQLTLPTGVKILSATNTTSLADGSGTKWTWSLRAEKPLTGEAKLTVTAANVEKVSARAPLKITAKLPVAQNGYVPEPQPVRGPFEVGVYYFPGWNTTARWQPLESYLERRPVLGCYREGDSEVADWHIKWAVEHGITFFAYDWYWSQGTRSLDHALHDGYFKARYRSLLKFCLLWANHNPPNTSSLADCLAVTRYWIENYFRRPEHLTVDGKLAVIIFAPSRLAEDLGHAGVKPVLEAMRAECRAAGLPGLHLIACVSDAASALAAAEQGYDAVTSYNWVHLGMTDDSNYAPYENLLGGYHTNWLDILRQSSAPLSPLPICGGWDARPWHGEN
ncbi:MAG: glycoside hydrolase family 127 protein, partial [Verrucomicrobia bacterium]|nr:glycoside hydrolase family 127 protein [Verrucomicrobiota bacterium]